MSKAWIRITDRLPLLIFLGMYAFSCYLGVLCLLLSRDFWAWTNYFSGPMMPPLDRAQLWTLLLLLNGGPILLWAGYEAATGVCRRYFKSKSFDILCKDPQTGRLDFFVYSLSVGITLVSLVRAGAFSNLAAWADYNAYVHARWALFSKLKFFEYVNIYTWLPLSSVFLLLCRRKWRWLFIPVLGTLAILQISLYLKKSLLTSIIMIGCAAWTYWYGGKTPRKEVRLRYWLRSGLALCLILYSIHAALSIRLVLSSRPRVFQLTQQELARAERERGGRNPLLEGPALRKGRSAGAATASTEPFAVTFDRTSSPSTSGRSVLLYAFFAPLTRSSVPTIAYAGLFPSHIPYYRLDIGLDILGFGRMPNDNLIVCDYLWPDQKGSIAVPFHFVLYSQGGMLVALLGAFLIGGFVSVCWYPVSACRHHLSVLGSLFAGIVLTYAWLISIDSLRNNTLESYGMIWAVVLIGFIYWWGRKFHTRGAQAEARNEGEFEQSAVKRAQR